MAAAGPQVQRDAQDMSPAAVAAVLVALAVVTVHLVGVRAFAREPLSSAAPETDLPLMPGVVGPGCLVLGVCAAWLDRVIRPGVAVGLAAAVFGAALPVWASWTGAPTELRSAVLAAPALTAAGLAQVVPRWTKGRGSAIGLVAWLFALVAVAVHVLGYDPFADPWCSRVCRSAGGPVVDAASPSVVLTVAGLLVLGVVVVGLVGVVVGQSTPAAVRVSVGVSLVAVGIMVGTELILRDTEVWARTTSAWLAWTLGPPAFVVSVIAFRAAAMRRAIDELLRDLEGGRGDGVHFAVPGERRWVDASGRSVPRNVPSVVVLYDELGPAVRLVGASGREDSASISPSRHLALANARLTALTAARLDDVRAAQRRTVQRADRERHRIERDLHDGAQQTLVSAAFHLSAVAARGGTSAEIGESQARVATALARLRDVVHGSVPTVLQEEGIRPALDDLAAEADSRVEVAVDGQGELPEAVAMAVYLCAAAIVGRAAPEPCYLELDIGDNAAQLAARSTADLSGSLTVEVLDRVGALGGSVVVAPGREGWSVEVRLPCGS